MNFLTMSRAGLGLILSVAMIACVVCGCGNKKIDAALDSDANGYVCAKCSEKFYTDRELFANVCPKCKDSDILQVVGYVCEKDKHVTVGARGRGAKRCEQCGSPTTGQMVPKESDLKGWGAAKKTGPEVGV